MVKKTNLIVISNTSIEKIPEEVFSEYKNWVLKDGLAPSVALNKFMNEYQCPNPDSSIVIHLIEFTYPEVDISRNNFTYKIHDSGYPHVQKELNDSGFDKLVEEMRTLPPEEW